MKNKGWLAALLTLALLALPIAPTAALSEEDPAPVEATAFDMGADDPMPFGQGEGVIVESAPAEAPVAELPLELGEEDAAPESGDATSDAEGLTLADGEGGAYAVTCAPPEGAIEANAAPEPAANDTVTVNDTVAAIDAVHFPDAVFRAYVASQCDLNGDGALSAMEALQVTEINVGKEGISSLTGIEYFSALESLECRENDLTALDLSRNAALKALDCSDNFIGSLELRRCAALEMLLCRNNDLAALDLSGNARANNPSRHIEKRERICYNRTDKGKRDRREKRP